MPKNVNMPESVLDVEYKALSEMDKVPDIWSLQ